MKRAGTALIALAALFWGISGGIAGILMADGWDPFVVSFYRGAIGLLFVGGWLMLRPRSSGLTSPLLWCWSAIAGLGVAGNFAFYFVSISEGGLAVAATLMYSAPVFVFLVSLAFGLEKQTPAKWLAIALVMFGIVLLTRIFETGSNGVTVLGAGAGLLSGLCYTIFIFGFKYATPHGSPQAILTIAFTVLIATLIWPGDAGQMVSALSTPGWPLFAVLGIFGAGLSFIFYVVGLKHTTPTVASVVAMVEPVTASIFGVVFLDEMLVGSQIFGMALILVTATALGIHSGARQHLPRSGLPD